MQALVKKFNDSQDKVVIDARNQGKDYDEVLAKYESAAATSPGSLPGLVYLEDGQLLIDFVRDVRGTEAGPGERVLLQQAVVADRLVERVR